MHTSRLIGSWLLWFLPSIVAAIFLARVSVYVQGRFAPGVLVPLICGALLGLVIIGLSRLAGYARRGELWLATAVVVISAAVSEHAFFYADFCNARQHEIDQSWAFQEIAANRDEPLIPTFWQYMRIEARNNRLRPLIWAGHGAVLLMGAVGVVKWLTTKPKLATSDTVNTKVS